MSKRELLIKIKENNGIITTKEALNLGIHKDILKELTIKEELEKKLMDSMHFKVKILMSIFISHIEYQKVFFLTKQQRIYKDYQHECPLFM